MKQITKDIIDHRTTAQESFTYALLAIFEGAFMTWVTFGGPWISLMNPTESSYGVTGTRIFGFIACILLLIAGIAVVSVLFGKAIEENDHSIAYGLFTLVFATVWTFAFYKFMNSAFSSYPENDMSGLLTFLGMVFVIVLTMIGWALTTYLVIEAVTVIVEKSGPTEEERKAARRRRVAAQRRKEKLLAAQLLPAPAKPEPVIEKAPSRKK